MDVQSVPQSAPKKSPLNFILSFVILILLSVLGYFIVQNYKLHKQLADTNRALYDVTSEFPTPSPDPTVNWKTYTDTKYKYTFMYPNTWQITSTDDPGLGAGPLNSTSIKSEAGKTFAQIFISRDLTWNELVKSAKDQGLKNYIFNGLDAMIFEKTGYDSSIYINLTENRLVVITTYNTEFNNPIFDQILSTFRFVDSTVSPTGNVINRVVIPNDWKSFTDSDTEFKTKVTMSLPPGYSFRFTGSEWIIQDDRNAEDLWDYRNSVFMGRDPELKNYYDGSSRRSWYQRYLNGDFSANSVDRKMGDVLSVKENFINNTSYLEATVTYYGATQKHYLYVQNGIFHMIRPENPDTVTTSPIPGVMDKIFYSLKSEILP